MKPEDNTSKKSAEVEGKSPNKHNKFYFIVEPLEDSIVKAVKDGSIPEMRIKNSTCIPFVAAKQVSGSRGSTGRQGSGNVKQFEKRVTTPG